jgi:CHAD domain-containing protein
MKWIRRLRAVRDVVLAARLVESSWQPHCAEQYDPDDLADLRDAVRRLRALD